MSLLDMDERLLDLAARADIVYSPLVDAKEFPPDVDITLVEGAVGTDDDVRRIRRIRERTHHLVSLGDCAVTTNVPGMRNPYGPEPLLTRAYVDNFARWADEAAVFATFPTLYMGLVHETGTAA
jgi:NAD-reducing hydrogenase small subunit